MGRIDYLFGAVERCGVFADIGCDHGYAAKRVADAGLADKIYITDISAPSLKKAEKLLAGYDNVISVKCDGFSGIPERVDEALIAGMGGEEIIKILSAAKFLPERLILQPMKNADKLRRFLSDNYRIKEDYTFKDGKFYDLITAETGADDLTEAEIQFGRTNLETRPEAFIEKIKKEIESIGGYLSRPLGERAEIELKERKKELEKLL